MVEPSETYSSQDDSPTQQCTVLEMELSPHEQQKRISLMFQDVSYHVGRGASKKILLHNVSGVAVSGELYCLLSPSGAGKTTLLDVIGGRKHASKVTGAVFFGGRKAKPSITKQLVGYCEQQESLIELLTLREMLTYTCRLACRKLRSGEVHARVATLMEELGLISAADTRIGGHLLPGISGGEKKRTHVATILLREPLFLLLDEVTSGLDAQAAAEVLHLLHRLVVKRNLVALLAVHAPSESMFAAFSTVLVLARGATIYQGPPEDAAPFLRAAICQHEPSYQGPSPGASAAEGIAQMSFKVHHDSVLSAALASHYAGSPLAIANIQAADSALAAAKADPLIAKEAREQIPAWWTLRVLFQYRILKNWLSPVFLSAQLMDKLFFSIILLSLYWGIGREQTTAGLQEVVNMAAALYIHSQLAAFSGMQYLSLLFRERMAFVQECNEGLLTVGTFLVSKLFEATPVALLVSAICNGILYPSLGLSGSFVLLWLVYALTQVVGVLIGISMWTMVPYMELAAGLCSVTIIVLCLLGGFLIVYAQIPVYWKWLATINPLRFAWGALVINQFEAQEVQSNATAAPSSSLIMLLQPSALQLYGFQGVDKWAYVGYLALAVPVLLVFNFVFAHIMLRFSKK